jgi:type VI secretion system secreted protein VgrG
VLAGTTVTNTGPSVISGSLGVSPGTAITGFPPGQVHNGSQHAADGVALGAKAALVTGYNDAAGRTPVTVVSTDLSGQTLAPGVYKSASALGLTGTVTLNAHGDAKAVFIFQAGSTLITGSGSKVRLTGGASACNVFWQVGSSATLGTNSTFVGTIMALTSASIQTGTTVSGRILARNGQVSLDNNRISLPNCAATPSPSSSASHSPTAAPSASHTPTAAPSTSSGGGGVIIPSGPPQTGAGGTYDSGIGIVTTIGIVALVGSIVAMGAAIRRRREWN